MPAKFALILLICLLTLSPVQAQLPNPTEIIAEDYYVTFVGWSPDGQWMAYFTHEQADVAEPLFVESGDLHFRQRFSDQTCDYPDMPVDIRYENGETQIQNLWLADGNFLNVGAGVVITPCGNQEPFVFNHAEPAIDAYSAPESTLLLRSEHQLLLVDLRTGDTRHVEGITVYNVIEDNFLQGKASVSPDGKQFAYTLTGPGSSYLIDIDSGATQLLYNEPQPAEFGPYGITPIPPLWLNNTLVIVTDADYKNHLINTLTYEQLELLEGYEILTGLNLNDEHFWVVLANEHEHGLYLSTLDRFEVITSGGEIELPTSGNSVMLRAERKLSLFNPVMDTDMARLVLVADSYYTTSWSQRLAFEPQYLAVGTQRALFVLNAITGEIKRIYAPETLKWFHPLKNGWSPDGQTLIIRAQSVDGAGYTLLMMDVSGS